MTDVERRLSRPMSKNLPKLDPRTVEDPALLAGGTEQDQPSQKRRVAAKRAPGGPEDLIDGADRLFPVRRLAANGLEAWAQVLARL
jgi:hypothetical protein